MQALRQFSIPLKGLDIKVHHFTYQIDNNFFAQFDHSPYKNGLLESTLELEKKYDNLLLRFYMKGTIKTQCDRCTADIDFPLTSDFDLIIKYDENEREEEDIIYIHPETQVVNVAKYIYEHIILSMPIIKVFDCDDIQPRPCDQEVLKHLEERNIETSANNPLGDALKSLNIKLK